MKKIIFASLLILGFGTISLSFNIIFNVKLGFSDPDPDYCIESFEKLQNELKKCKKNCDEFEGDQQTKCLQDSMSCAKKIEQEILKLYNECSSEFQKKIEAHQKKKKI